jgi:hypothetical protein
MSEHALPVGEELDPILLDLGSALYVCQGLEGSLVFLLSVCSMEDAEMEGSSFAAAMDNLSQKTLGQLLKRVRERLELSPEVDQSFRAGWNARNWIVHEFVHDTIEELLTPKGRLVVAKRLSEAKKTVKLTDLLANRILDTYLEKYGITVADMKESADRLWDHLNPKLPGSLN